MYPSGHGSEERPPVHPLGFATLHRDVKMSVTLPVIGQLPPKIINYKIRKLAEIDRHEEFIAADFYM